MNWTNEQKRVIEIKNKNILVSAAAGSGKTAVLVERIIKMITDGGIDIDKILVLTFTSAAAAEMKERIETAIEKEIEDNPKDTHLQKQLMLIPNASITTIDSFCLNIIRNNFNTIDIDPSFRVLEEAENKLMKSDVIEELLESYYEEASEEFYDFIESYAMGKTDLKIEGLILQLYRFSQSYPWPMDWLSSLSNSFEIDSVETMEKTEWMKFLMNYIKSLLKDFIKNIEHAIDLSNASDGPYLYLPMLEDDLIIINTLYNTKSYFELEDKISNLNFSRLSSKKDTSISTEKREEVKNIRNDVKKTLENIKKKYFFQPSSEMLCDIKNSQISMEMLIKLTKEFSIKFSETKVSKNVIDFNDMEHLALDILVKKEGKEFIPTSVAIDLSEYFEEILIDEYQDSNHVQEMLLNSISKEKFEKPNMFMVGDVKQSIYKFRLARPELFMDKYNIYVDETYKEIPDNKYAKIDLHKNFRSREVVLCGINEIFKQIMTKELGNIDYNDNIALHAGASFLETNKNISKDVDVILVNLNTEEILEGDDDSLNELSDYTNIELEARAIANKIKELITGENPLYVWDKTDYRKAKYSDIVILLRTLKGWSDVFVDQLMSNGIPAHADSTKGYFSTIEVRTVLNLLRIIDNPRQDIALAGVLKSPIVNMTSEELGKIRAISKGELYTCLLKYIKEGEEELIKSKLISFTEQINKYRLWVSYMPIDEIINKILEDTNYYNYLSAMPAGNKRRANIEMLLQKAIQFEKTSYTGLFNFVRYIDKLKEYDVDFGEVSVIGEKDNTVRIMSIHKSKGLEFPIVFASGMGKNFNNMESKETLLIHPDLGLGPDFIDYKLRTKTPTLIKKAIADNMSLENLSEELRILYVALTRAKEKLIITGGVKKLEASLKKWISTYTQKDIKLLFTQLTKAKNYYDFIIPALVRNKAFEPILKRIDITPNDSLYINNIGKYQIDIVDLENLINNEISTQLNVAVIREELISWNENAIHDEEFKNKLKEKFNFIYPYEKDIKLKSKLTVTELKKLNKLDVQVEDYSEKIYDLAEEMSPIIPEFMSQEDKETKAYIGTIYHKILETISFKSISSMETLESELNTILQQNIITEEELKLVSKTNLFKFFNSDIGKRMINADSLGKLFKEKQFIIGVRANEINNLAESEEIVLIQGIVDVYFEDNNNLVIVDFKTDRVNNENTLIEKYEMQLNYYKKALEQISNMNVKEKIIYSFGLNKEIKLN